MNRQNQPITHISWGKIKVLINGKVHKFKDCKVWPEGAKNWDWHLTGTNHEPGIQPADIEEILEKNIDVMILSRGMDLKMNICPETEALLKSKNIPYFVEETKKAVELFNELCQAGKRVGGIFHTTC